MEEQLHIRTLLKIVRDPTKTAYDELPNGKIIGDIANQYAVERYKSKNARKKIQTQETRKRKKEELKAQSSQNQKREVDS